MGILPHAYNARKRAESGLAASGFEVLLIALVLAGLGCVVQMLAITDTRCWPSPQMMHKAYDADLIRMHEITFDHI